MLMLSANIVRLNKYIILSFMYLIESESMIYFFALWFDQMP